jgi:hypothetical protein
MSLLPVTRNTLFFSDLIQERVHHVGGGLDVGLEGFRQNDTGACCFARLEELNDLDDLSLGWRIGINVKQLGCWWYIW